MLDFMKISTGVVKKRGKEYIEIYPTFIMKKSSDLMIRGSDFYAIWDEERKLWSTDEQDVIRLVDQELESYLEKNRSRFDSSVQIAYMKYSNSGSIDAWHKYCQKQSRDNYHPLDENLTFSNMDIKKTDYASKKLNYPLEEGECPAWDKLISTLYSEEERHKIEWAIGSIVTGASKELQKFVVLYGAAGTGKSTILNIVQMLFDGYYCVFDAKALGSNNNQFALEAFKKNPRVAIQHDGDLSRIEDNTQLNSVVSHEEMTVNEKYKGTYPARFTAFLFMGTNTPVKITDSKSGLLRRLIDVHPTGNKVAFKEYKTLMKQITFELGAIACHCRDIFLDDPEYYDDYVPTDMMYASNDFYNFVVDSYSVFKKENGTTLKAAWEMYKLYCEDAKVPGGGVTRRKFQEELKEYFERFEDNTTNDDGSKIRNYYSGFKTYKFEEKKKTAVVIDNSLKPSWAECIEWVGNESIFNDDCSGCPAQYATDSGTPMRKWENVKTRLSDIDTSKLHYVKIPENHIVIDFDIKGPDGKKSYERNLEEASKWPKTYAELSKSGAGIHLHYIYTGDVTKLSRVYDENIEIKVFTGNSSLRRMLTKCNNEPIANISSGLPLKGEKMLNKEVVQSERGLRTTIKRCLNKEIHPGTKPNVDFIYKILEDAYNGGLKYDVTDMENAVFAFAMNSTNQSEYCMELVAKMHFKSDEPAEQINADEEPIVFYDIEVFPNLFLVNWKYAGADKPVVRMINPSPSDIEELMRYRLVGFNCRRYDNHIIYARHVGYSIEDLYELSQKIITEGRGFFGEAYNLSYTDVYDFSAKKQSLKKWEIELGIHHQELGLPWDQPVPEELWIKVAEYCDNDVIATEATFNHLKGDFTARQILADLAGMSVNDTTNSLTTRIIFGKNRKPQNEFCYRNLAEPVKAIETEVYNFLRAKFPEMMSTTHGEASSILPYFPGYKHEFGKSIYRGEEVGEGGYVYAEPGMYGNVALLDVASMHPTSTIAECLFGPRFTKAYLDIVEGRVNIKHEAWNIVNEMLEGKLSPFIQKVLNGEMTSKDLATALKIAINSVYGLTAASFENPFRDPRNIDNIVAKRGALFMVDLKHEVQKRGFTVAHIKTDSIKIPDATDEIIQFVIDFGKKYGYTFEHEATYDRMCLVNDAVYIAKYAGDEVYEFKLSTGEKIITPWTATGKQFAVPYLFKTLFCKEPIKFDDMCETFAVSKGDLHLDMNENLPDVTVLEEVKEYRLKRPDWTLNGMERLTKANRLLKEYKDVSDEELDAMIAEGHNLIFVGRVGQFCPIKPGNNGGVLYRVYDGKNYAAAGSTGYRWLESEVVKTLGKEDCIDRSFYDKLVNEAVEDISKYGDFEWFVSDDPYVPDINYDFMNIPLDADEELPWDLNDGGRTV